jgi:hypothetical protein
MGRFISILFCPVDASSAFWYLGLSVQDQSGECLIFGGQQRALADCFHSVEEPHPFILQFTL